jgi:menaquinone-dependent protoporphyrinogen oxidase
MSPNILVAYATSHGSTQEIANVIAETLRSNGLTVELRTLRSVQSLEGYRGLVIGAPLYMFRWHNDARSFIKKYQKTLNSLPVAVFAGGPFGEQSSPQDWQEVSDKFNQELASFTGFKPCTVEIMGGKFDPSHLHFPWNWVPALRSMPASDLRDWDKIRAWASGLTPLFN